MTNKYFKQRLDAELKRAKSKQVNKDSLIAARIKFMKEILSAVKKNMKLRGITSYLIKGITNKPKGQKQKCSGFFDHKYVEQYKEDLEEVYYTEVYYPLGCGEYLIVVFFC